MRNPQETFDRRRLLQGAAVAMAGLASAAFVGCGNKGQSQENQGPNNVNTPETLDPNNPDAIALYYLKSILTDKFTPKDKLDFKSLGYRGKVLDIEYHSARRMFGNAGKIIRH